MCGGVDDEDDEGAAAGVDDGDVLACWAFHVSEDVLLKEVDARLLFCEA